MIKSFKNATVGKLQNKRVVVIQRELELSTLIIND
jgi:hypothetical protein